MEADLNELSSTDLAAAENNHEGGDGSEIIRNPLEIPVIVREVIPHLAKVKDLGSVRCLNKLWRDESLDLWRDTAVFVLNESSEPSLKQSLGIRDNAGGNAGTADPAVFSLYRLEDKPFRRYKIERLPEKFVFPPDDVPAEEQFYFWERIGPHLKSLAFGERKVCYFRKGHALDGFKWLLNACPNLEELRMTPHEELRGTAHLPVNQFDTQGHNLKMLSISGTGRSTLRRQNDLFRGKPQLCREFLRIVPKLKTLELNEVLYYEDVMEGVGMYLVDPTRPAIQLENLKITGINDYYDDQSLEVLSQHLNGDFSLQLKSIGLSRVCFSDIWRDPWSFKRVLNWIRDSIQEVNWTFGCGRRPWIISPHRTFDLYNCNFPQLTHLNLQFDYSVSENNLSFDFNVFRGTPNLRYFRFASRNATDLFLTRKLTAEDLEVGNGESWHRDNGVERLSINILNWLNQDFEQESLHPMIPLTNPITLDKLKEFHFEGSFSAEALQSLGGCAKNLKVFETILDDETFPVPFLVWPETLKKVTMLLLEEGAVEETLISDQQKKTPNVEIRMTARSRDMVGTGW